MSIKIKLEKPIEVYGDEVIELELREPTPEDVISTGLPQLMIPSADGESYGIEIRTKVIAAYIVRLAQIPKSSIKAMTLKDFQACTKAINVFFGGADGEKQVSDPSAQETTPSGD